MKYIDIKDIKPGDIILTCNGNFISYVNADKKVSHWICINGDSYSNYKHDPCNISEPTKATYSQIQHLKACMKVDKYVESIEEEMNEDYKGELRGFPREIVEKMLDRQEDAGNERDVSVFENHRSAIGSRDGFSWAYSIEGDSFWDDIISARNFKIFFDKYPKDDKTVEKEVIIDHSDIKDLIEIFKLWD